MRTIQNLIVHYSIGKRKIVLHQLREGMKILGFADAMKKHPELYKVLFVAGEAELQNSKVTTKLDFPVELSAEEETTKGYLLQFISEASENDLKSFLTFATGAPKLPLFGLGNIKVDFSDRDGIFSSTCLFHVTFPRSFPDQATFSSSLLGVCENSGKAFSTV